MTREELLNLCIEVMFFDNLGPAAPGIKKRIGITIGLLLLLVGFLGLISCGGSGAGSSPLGATNNAPPGSYTVTVSATGTTTQITQTRRFPLLFNEIAQQTLSQLATPYPPN